MSHIDTSVTSDPYRGTEQGLLYCTCVSPSMTKLPTALNPGAGSPPPPPACRAASECFDRGPLGPFGRAPPLLSPRSQGGFHQHQCSVNQRPGQLLCQDASRPEHRRAPHEQHEQHAVLIFLPHAARRRSSTRLGAVSCPPAALLQVLSDVLVWKWDFWGKQKLDLIRGEFGMRHQRVWRVMKSQRVWSANYRYLTEIMQRC